MLFYLTTNQKICVVDFTNKLFRLKLTAFVNIVEGFMGRNENA